MPRFVSNLFVDVAVGSVMLLAFEDEEAKLFNDIHLSAAETLSSLALKVRRRPQDLLLHLQRIYLCFRNALPEPLYAALLDLLIVLDGKGKAFSSRLLAGSRSKLSAEQWRALETVSQTKQFDKGNRYSLFTRGLIGSSLLLEAGPKLEAELDYLDLAQDFIEYSQLDDAMKTLEQGMQKTPGRRDLQMALLEIYRSTESYDRFRKHYDVMRQSGEPLIDEWQNLAGLFDGKTS